METQNEILDLWGKGNGRVGTSKFGQKHEGWMVFVSQAGDVAHVYYIAGEIALF